MPDEADLERYDRILHENAGKFHANFNTGQFEANGPLVTEDIDINSNNVRLVGRQNFVDRIKRFSIPFPGMQLKDEVRIIDGNIAAVMYLMQGEHGGPYGEYQATHSKVEAAGGEVFEFNTRGQMTKLRTVTELDQVTAYVQGLKKLTKFRDVSFQTVADRSPLFENQIRANAGELFRNMDAGSAAKNDRLFSPQFTMTQRGEVMRGRAAFNEQFDRLKTSFPDLSISTEYVLAEGNWASVAYVLRGTQTGAYTTTTAVELPPSNRNIEVRGISFFEFDPDGLLVSAAMIWNPLDIEQQTQAS